MARPATPARRLFPVLPVIVVWTLIAAYTLFFSAYTLQRHATLNTYAADLSFIHQPMWNTLHGRFLERTLDARQVPRVAEHFEPLLVPLSLVLLLWDDPRALLILQTVALALGALPVFWIARDVLRRSAGLEHGAAGWLAVAFAATYLLFPALQAANVADFHADPFVVAPLLFAFRYALQRRWLAMWAWAILVMAAKENMATLTAMLGLLLVLRAWRERRDLPLRPVLVQAVALIGVSVAWFAIATFLIVAPLAREAYGTEGPVYLATRYVEFGATPGEWLRIAWETVRQPARTAYVAGLFASVAWLALLAPEYLLLGLPILIANVFSNFPGQFSGEQHYSAPLAAPFLISAIYGTARLIRRAQRLPIGHVAQRLAPKSSKRLQPSDVEHPERLNAEHPEPQETEHPEPQETEHPERSAAESKDAVVVATLLVAWLLAGSLSQQIDRGWTPLSRYFTWPQRTAHHVLLDRFLAQVPPEVPVSASPAIHPHLASRHKIYVYPIVEDAEYILVDLSGTTDMHPIDLRRSLEDAVNTGRFGILDAADGYLLLQRGNVNKTWPADLASFARGNSQPPQYSCRVRFGDALELTGYDVVDEPRWRMTRFRFHFTVTAALPPVTAVRYEARRPDGAVVDSSDLRPLPALVWHDPEQWQPGEQIVLETASWFLPRTFAPLLIVNPLAPEPLESTGCPAQVTGDTVLLPPRTRIAGRLDAYRAPAAGIPPSSAAFAAPGWTVQLQEWTARVPAAPGSVLPVTFAWRSTAPAPKDYNLFLHLRNRDGATVAQADGQPAWFTPRPASQWPTGETIRDARSIALPPDLAPGVYRLVAGWYDWQTGERLEVMGENGTQRGNELVLGDVMIGRAAGPRADAVCLMAPESCASLP